MGDGLAQCNRIFRDFWARAQAALRRFFKPMTMETGKDGQPVMPFEDQKAFETWLEKNHASCEKGIWLKFAKKGTGISSVNYAEALDVALCYGWIDGIVKSVDETYYLQKFTPRRPKCKWSQRNREHVARLIQAKRMRPAGLKEVEAAKVDGRWEDAYASPSKIEVPADFQAALDAHPRAAKFFAGLKGMERYSFLYRLHHVKKEDARAKRIAMYIERLEAGELLSKTPRKGLTQGPQKALRPDRGGIGDL